MSDTQPADPRDSIQEIPLEVRPAMAEWLRGQSAVFDDTAERLFLANRKLQDEGVKKNVAYWRNCASAARYLAGILTASGLKPVRARRVKKDERSK